MATDCCRSCKTGSQVPPNENVWLRPCKTPSTNYRNLKVVADILATLAFPKAQTTVYHTISHRQKTSQNEIRFDGGRETSGITKTLMEPVASLTVCHMCLGLPQEGKEQRTRLLRNTLSELYAHA